ncbi:MAG TPA: ATP-binding protein [Candidatus Limnocylindrales bacterium]
MVAVHTASGVSERAPRGSHRHGLMAARGARVTLLVTGPIAGACVLLAAEDTFELGVGITVAAILVILALVGLVLAVAMRELQTAEVRADEALVRAFTAEASAKSHAVDLARVLKASESLVLTGNGQADYLDILAAITPQGGMSFLVRPEGESEAVVVAAHGPVADSLIGVRRPLSVHQDPIVAAEFATLGESGRVAAAAPARLQAADVDMAVEATLRVDLVDHNGSRLGWLELVDPMPDRILEPSFVNLAQLVANQIGVAMENRTLLTSVQRQLAEVQRVQQQLVQASKLGAVGELAAIVAHEVNNPLTGILGFAELLLSELPEDDPRRDEAEVIRTEAVRARTIIKALLEFARPRPPQRIPTNLNELARTTLDLQRSRAEKAKVEVIEEYADLPLLEVDADALKQVLLNLLNNSMQAMPHGGQLRVATRAEGEAVAFVVADTGVGMDAETRSRIFTPFFSTRAGNAGGTGLGLSVSMRIVEGHHGTIDVESEPGKGAVFTIRLPIARHSPDGSVQASEAEARVQEVPWDAESDGGAEASLQFRREEAA